MTYVKSRLAFQLRWLPVDAVAALFSFFSLDLLNIFCGEILRHLYDDKIHKDYIQFADVLYKSVINYKSKEKKKNNK